MRFCFAKHFEKKHQKCILETIQLSQKIYYTFIVKNLILSSFEFNKTFNLCITYVKRTRIMKSKSSTAMASLKNLII